MSQQEMQEKNGGFTPLVILGVSFSAKAVAGWIGGCFLAGVGVGATVAASK